MQFLNFTPQETKALLFLLIALLVGSGITFYKKDHPSFAPELVFNQNPSGSSEIRSQFSPDPKDTNSPWQDTSHEISKNIITSSVSGQLKKNRSLSIRENALEKIVDLNSASASQLELLPQIGPVLSQRIINYRNTKGKFKKIEDLLKVPGIGPKTFDKIKEFVAVK
jgi:comEA protein